MIAAFALSLLLGVGQAPPDDLTTVREHYATAAYEEALAHIGALDPAQVTPRLEQYRALCLMALGRTEEGTLAFERLVRRSPLYIIPEAEVSPRMFDLFSDVRQRVLPLVVREMFNRGKASYDEKRYEAATAELRELMRLLSDPAATTDATTFADLRQLADGFLRLAEAEMAAAARAAAPPPPVADPVAAPATPAAAPAAAASTRPDAVVVERIVVYSREDREVVPPVEVSRFMPPWNPPPAMRSVEYRGELEVIVDETGRVQDRRMVRPSNPSYDVTLLGATESWRFEPARLNGTAVKYRLTYQIVLASNR